MHRYVIKRDRVAFIENNFFEFSFNEQSNEEIEPDRQKFEQLAHPAELHYLALIYNWDDGNTIPLWIVESPYCSKATANLIFWLTAPDYYRRYALDESDIERDDLETLTIIRTIFNRHENNDFSNYHIEFDPEEYLEKTYEKAPKWNIPYAMYEKIEGTELFIENEDS